MLEALKIIGAILGIVAFLWKVWDAWASYLHIFIEKPLIENGNISVRVAIENRNLFSKKIKNALLLIGPESESPIKTANDIASHLGIKTRIKVTNSIEGFCLNDPVYTTNGQAIIPLPFFYNEQIRIGDEELSYRCSLESKQFKEEVRYAIRFFIFGEKRLHRSTQESFLIPNRIK